MEQDDRLFLEAQSCWTILLNYRWATHRYVSIPGQQRCSVARAGSRPVISLCDSLSFLLSASVFSSANCSRRVEKRSAVWPTFPAKMRTNKHWHTPKKKDLRNTNTCMHKIRLVVVMIIFLPNQKFLGTHPTEVRRSELPGRSKAWFYQHSLLRRVSWSVLVYNPHNNSRIQRKKNMWLFVAGFSTQSL